MQLVDWRRRVEMRVDAHGTAMEVAGVVVLPYRLEPLARDRPQPPALVAADDQRAAFVKERGHPTDATACRKVSQITRSHMRAWLRIAMVERGAESDAVPA
jgi:hypothetical protein